MPVLFTGVVACEEYVEARDIDEEHSRTEDMASGIRSYPDSRDGVRRVEIDSLDLRECVEVVLFGVEDIALVRGG